MWERGVQRAWTKKKCGQRSIKIKTGVDQSHGIPTGEDGITFLGYESTFSWHFSFSLSFLLSLSSTPSPLQTELGWHMCGQITLRTRFYHSFPHFGIEELLWLEMHPGKGSGNHWDRLRLLTYFKDFLLKLKFSCQNKGNNIKFLNIWVCRWD